MNTDDSDEHQKSDQQRTIFSAHYLAYHNATK